MNLSKNTFLKEVFLVTAAGFLFRFPQKVRYLIKSVHEENSLNRAHIPKDFFFQVSFITDVKICIETRIITYFLYLTLSRFQCSKIKWPELKLIYESRKKTRYQKAK